MSELSEGPQIPEQEQTSTEASKGFLSRLRQKAILAGCTANTAIFSGIAGEAFAQGDTKAAVISAVGAGLFGFATVATGINAHSENQELESESTELEENNK